MEMCAVCAKEKECTLRWAFAGKGKEWGLPVCIECTPDYTAYGILTVNTIKPIRLLTRDRE